MKKFLLALTLLSTVALAQMDHDMGSMNGTTMGNSSNKALAGLSNQAYDVAWLSQMIEHHRGAVQMSVLCVKNCVDKDVKNAAQKIIEAQDKEILLMTTWLQKWYNTKPDPKQIALIKADMKPMMDKATTGMTPMAGMKMAIDRSFLEGMIPHHQHAVDMGQDASKRAFKAELRKFGLAVVNDQTKEIKQYQGWLKTKKL
jgi:uncharacterized protein (DUF305 family)